MTWEELAARGILVTPLQTGAGSGWPHGPDVLLQCPGCGTYVRTDRYDACRCGAVAVDLDACRVAVRGLDERSISVVRCSPGGTA
jgi:hypothetical protein